MKNEKNPSSQSRVSALLHVTWYDVADRPTSTVPYVPTYVPYCGADGTPGSTSTKVLVGRPIHVTVTVRVHTRVTCWLAGGEATVTPSEDGLLMIRSCPCWRRAVWLRNGGPRSLKTSPPSLESSHSNHRVTPATMSLHDAKNLSSQPLVSRADGLTVKLVKLGTTKA